MNILLQKGLGEDHQDISISVDLSQYDDLEFLCSRFDYHRMHGTLYKGTVDGE